MDYEYAKEVFDLEDENLTIRRSIKVEDDENEFENTIVIEQYNKRVENYSSILCMRKKFKKTISACLSGKRVKDFSMIMLCKSCISWKINLNCCI